ncbi:MAG: Gfo/Idh/MocA family oxidoreductase [Clostridia bacterium]|nr:Gfo/Idh/MocA family oxidoreductase [Clostridia bacterium]MBQ7053137.1 Gfo/Idh/MocA family oxidoreductase [Clostridia bacterium]
MNVKEKIRFAVVGNGWRALFFVRAAKNLPALFELTGVLLRSREKAEAFAAEYGVPTFYEMDALLETKPEFVVSCQTKKAISDMTLALMERGMNVLSETPYAIDEDTLEALMKKQAEKGVVLDLAEQYFLYPTHQARRAVVNSGVLGEVQNVWMNMMHDYHGISMLRAYLGEESGPVTIRARMLENPIVVTGSRAGYHTDGEMGAENRTLAQFDYGDGRSGLYDFSGTQYHSAIRSNHMRVLGTRGEMFDDEVRYLREDNRPAVARLVYHRDEITGTVRAIDFDGRRVYENPFPADVAMTEDDIAVSTVLMRMGRAVRGGERHYPLDWGMRDSYMAILLTRAAHEGAEIAAERYL